MEKAAWARAKRPMPTSPFHSREAQTRNPKALLLGMLGPVLGMALAQFAALFLTVYTTCAQAAFYQEYAVGPLPGAKTEEAASPEMTD